MKQFKKIAIAALVTTMFSGQAMAWDNGTAGTLLGGAGGAAIGSQFGKGNGKLVGVAIGTLLGAGIGNSVGTSMDRGDAAYYGQQQPRQVAYTQTYREEWREPRGRGHHKKWKHRQEPRYVQRDVYVEQYAYAEPEARSTQYCREYTSPVVVGGAKQSSYGTACYMPDGSWQIQNNK